MPKSDAESQELQIQEENKKFSELDKFNHESNAVAKAQKQMSSQETTGVLDQD